MHQLCDVPIIWGSFWVCTMYTFLQASPEVFCAKDRTRDIDAIHQVIQSAKTFIFISVTDYLPLVNRRFRGTSVTRYSHSVASLDARACARARGQHEWILNCMLPFHIPAT